MSISIAERTKKEQGLCDTYIRQKGRFRRIFVFKSNNFLKGNNYQKNQGSKMRQLLRNAKSEHLVNMTFH